MCLSFAYECVKKEVFVGFLSTKTTDRQSLYELAMKAVKSLNLDLKNIVGECFDEASNMSGTQKGLATLMKQTSPLAIYVHCYVHWLNLVLQHALSSVECLKMLWEPFKVCTMSLVQVQNG